MTAHANANIPASSWLELPDGRTFWLKASGSVGRQPDNELILESLTLSRRHARLTAEGDGYTVSDLHSRNGTFLNGSAITRPVPLRDCDELRFGDVIVRYRCTRQLAPTALADDPAATRRFDHVRERPCWLLLVDVVGFASLSEKLGSEAAHHRLQEWITGLRPLIETHEGHINGYLGDAIFAYWLADVALPGSLLLTLQAIEKLRPASPLPFRLVAHHGRALFTHSDRGEELTGHDVNFLFRSEKIAKSLRCSAMLSEPAVRTLGLEGRSPLVGQSAIEGMTGLFSFYGLPPDLPV
jgi:pSer/pThr/pTyr-binding forkhead associated (FHA) protein